MTEITAILFWFFGIFFSARALGFFLYKQKEKIFENFFIGGGLLLLAVLLWEIAKKSS